MTNVKTHIENNVLTITIRLDENHGASSTGKTNTVASTGGFVALPGTDAKLSLNVNRPLKPRIG